MLSATHSLLPLAGGLVLFVGTGLIALHGTFVPQSRIWGHNLSHGSLSQPRIALTFDDGPTPASTPQVLDILRQLAVPAAFFVIGRSAAASPDLLQRIVAEGHLLENHSTTHAHLGMFRGPRFWKREIDETTQVIEHSTGVTPRYFRPPVGMKNFFTLRAARRANLQTVTWSCRGMDGLPTTSQRIVDRVATRAKAGDIIALHDGVEPGSSRDPQVTVDALKPLILKLRERGLQFVRLDELLAEHRR